ncbi:MAG: DUF948 domain-containing protein, partial [Planctomycetota bacterium]
MDEYKLKQWLKEADAAVSLAPVDAGDVAAAVSRRLVRRKRTIHYGMPVAAAVLVVVGLFGSRSYQAQQKQRQIAQLEQQVQQLTEQTQATLAKIEQLLDDQQASLQKVSRYSDPAYKIEAAVDEAAFILMYQAERMAEKYNRPDAAA